MNARWICALAFVGCGNDGPSQLADATAQSDGTPQWDGGLEDAGPSLAWVEMSVEGCQSGAGTEDSPCLGSAPLTLRFTALAPSPPTSFRWDFGDGTEPATERSVAHTYESPGSYPLRLDAEGPGGTAGVTHLAAVVVVPAPLGGKCSDDAVCASGMCACDDTTCPEVFASGICLLECTSISECGDNACVDLTSATALSDWRRRTCLPNCSVDGDCGHGNTCLWLPDPEGAPIQACLPAGALGSMGSPCLDSSGVPDHDACGSHECFAVGNHGMCSFTCEDGGECPSDWVCATFDNGARCIQGCTQTSCEGDQGLNCQPLPLGSSVSGTSDPAGYCLPLDAP